MFPKDVPILVVDDMAGDRERFRVILNGLGYDQILEAEDGALALTQLEVSAEMGQPVKLAIVDWNMPNMDGLSFLKHVRSNDYFRQLPIIFLTAIGESANVVQAIKAGVNDYIVKPTNADTVQKKMAAVWNKIAKTT